MKMPNKVTPYKESSIAKFPVILELLEKKNMTPSELFSKVRKNKIQSIDEFVEIIVMIPWILVPSEFLRLFLN